MQKTYNVKISTPQQKPRIGTVSKKLGMCMCVCVGGGRGLKSILRGQNRSVVVYTRHSFSPREGLLTHQCNISENIKSNEYRGETAMFLILS